MAQSEILPMNFESGQLGPSFIVLYIVHDRSNKMGKKRPEINNAFLPDH